MTIFTILAKDDSIIVNEILSFWKSYAFYNFAQFPTLLASSSSSYLGGHVWTFRRHLVFDRLAIMGLPALEIIRCQIFTYNGIQYFNY